MNLQIRQREKEGIRILDLQGRLVIGDSEAALRSTLIALAKDGDVNVILNFAETKEIDDDGLGALVVCYACLRRSGGALKLLNLSRVHMDLFVLMKLDTVFEVFQDEQDAVNSFFPDRAVRRFDILTFVEQMKKHPSP
jgi:anti-sigma B factor antagonist